MESQPSPDSLVLVKKEPEGATTSPTPPSESYESQETVFVSVDSPNTTATTDGQQQPEQKQQKLSDQRQEQQQQKTFPKTVEIRLVFGVNLSEALLF